MADNNPAESPTATDPAPLDASPPGPVDPSQRYRSLDVLRGIAVLGILVMNIYAFAMPFVAYSNPLAMGGTEPWNLGTWYVTHIFFDQKFMTIFSMLYGAGIALLAERAGERFNTIFYRRSLWLLLIGLAHAYLIWFGDILFFYALIGMLVCLLRNKSARTLIVVACCMLPVAPLMAWGGGTYMQDLAARAESYEALAVDGETLTEEQQSVIDEWREARVFIAPGPEELDADLAAYRSDYATIFQHRIPVVRSMQVDGTLFFVLWRVGGLMLIGMALMKLGILAGKKSREWYLRLALSGYGLGLPLTIFSAVNLSAHGFDSLYAFRIGQLPNYVGSVLVAFGHVGLILLLVRTDRLRGLLDRFAAVGRMAFSNYLAHSLILTTVFYGYGFGLYGELPRLMQMGVVAAVIGAQLLWSAWWLSRYRFGPAEWLWRSLSYWRRQPLRR